MCVAVTLALLFVTAVLSPLSLRTSHAFLQVSAFVPASLLPAAGRVGRAGRAGSVSVKMGLFDSVFGGGSKKTSQDSLDLLDRDFKPSAVSALPELHAS